MSFKANVNAAYDNTTIIGTDTNRFRENATAFVYNNSFEFKDSMKQANEYTYDANGNLTKDLNKNITGISYNCLNLPNTVTFSDGSTITYIYGADGTKLRTVHKIGTTTTTTDYCGNVVYENGVQKLLLTEEGYVTLSDNKYHYYLKDHQGNHRVVINQSGTVEETNHYYPFGGVFASTSNTQPYKYNGKEYDSKKGLNWYDYGARHYDAALGRCHANDRFVEKYYSMSPYQYGANNPVNNIDVNGDTIVVNPNPNGLIDNVKMFFGFDTKYQKDVKVDLQQLKKDDKGVANIITELEDSENIHYITMPKKGASNSTLIDKEKVEMKISQGSIIHYDPNNRRRSRNEKEMRTPRVGLSHELQHSVVVIGGIAFFFHIVYKHSEKAMMVSDLDRVPITSLMSVNIKWQDSTYCTVLESVELFSILEEEGKKTIPQLKLPKKEFIELSYKDTLIVDSLSFIQLKDYIVIPQYRIDSIYENEGVKGLLSAYFDDVWFIPSCEDGILTLPEQRYVIDILHRCGYCVDIDCESGCIYIVSSPDIG